MGYRLAACADLANGVPHEIYSRGGGIPVKGNACGAGAQIHFHRELGLGAAQRRRRRVEANGRTDFTVESVARGTGSLAPRRRTTVIQVMVKHRKGDSFWGLNTALIVWANHGSF